MTDQQFEDLAKRWPDLFQKAKVESFAVGEGWIHILDTLCGLISTKVESARRQLKYALENPDSKFMKSIDELEADLEEALKNLPTIVQVKEKFGGLRFYVDGGTTAMDHYIRFAEEMSEHTCEECGAPGEQRNTGWVRTLCERHWREHEEQEPNRS